MRGRSGLAIKWGVFLLSLITSAVVIRCWTTLYNSDHATIVLHALRYSLGEDLPLFFSETRAYFGVALEVFVVGTFFKIFGYHPIVASIAIWPFYVLFLYLFYRVARFRFSSQQALLGVALIILGFPHFTYVCHRTNPNYVETFLLGTLTFYLYLKIIHLLKAPPTNTSSKKIQGYAGLLGVVAGFGIYIYAQIYYFLASIALHFFVLVFRDLRVFSQKSFFRNLFFPFSMLQHSKWRELVWVAGGLGWYWAFWNLIFWIFFAGSPYEGKRYFDQVLLFAFAWAFALIAQWTFHQWKLVKKHLLAVALGGVGLFVGYFPKFYYTTLLGKTSMHVLGMHGDKDRLKTQAWDAVVGFKQELLSLGSEGWRSALAIFIAILLGVGLWVEFKKIFQFIRNRKQTSKHFLTELNPMVFMPLMVIAGYACSDWILDKHSVRYLMAAFPSLCFLLAIGFFALYQHAKSQKKRAVLVALLLVLFGDRAWSYRGEWIGYNPHPDEHLLLEEVKKEGIQYGYGDFWVSYLLTSLSHEEILMEPLYSKYLPYYEPYIFSRKYLGYVDRKPVRYSMNADGTITLMGYRYRVLRHREWKGFEIFSLENLYERATSSVFVAGQMLHGP